MKAVLSCFKALLLSVKTDRMLQLCCAVPLLSGAFFRFGIPALEALLMRKLGLAAVIAPYYILFDLLFSLLTPMIFCYVTAMVILEERDDHVALYLSVTPLGKKGYFLARLGMPALVSFIVTALLLPAFSLTGVSLGKALLYALCGTAQALIIALLVVSFSQNKLEGMAVTKLSSLLMLGMFAPFFMRGNAQYLLAFLPSFWLARAAEHGVAGLICLVLSALWMLPLLRRFAEKTAG